MFSQYTLKLVLKQDVWDAEDAEVIAYSERPCGVSCRSRPPSLIEWLSLTLCPLVGSSLSLTSSAFLYLSALYFSMKNDKRAKLVTWYVLIWIHRPDWPDRAFVSSCHFPLKPLKEWFQRWAVVKSPFVCLGLHIWPHEGKWEILVGNDKRPCVPVLHKQCPGFLQAPG